MHPSTSQVSNQSSTKILVLHSDSVQLTVIYAFTNNTEAPNGDVLCRINSLSSSSSNCFFNLFNSIGAILDEAIDIGTIPGIISISNQPLDVVATLIAHQENIYNLSNS